MTVSALQFARYLITVVVAAAIAFLVPVPLELFDSIHPRRMTVLLKPNPTIVMFGPSTVDQASPCDSDKRTIPAMLQDQLHRPVLDDSTPGQTLEESVNFAALFSKTPAAKTIVILVNVPGFAERNNFNLHEYYVFRVLNPELAVDDPITYFHGLPSMEGLPQKENESFVYDGKTYPGVLFFNKSLFPAEHALETCPEGDGHDLTRIAALTYHRMIEYGPDPRNITQLGSLSRALQKRGEKLVVVIPPADNPYLSQFDAAWPAILTARRREILAGLARESVTTVDIADELPKADYVMRWCGCIHLNQEGRNLISARIAAAL